MNTLVQSSAFAEWLGSLKDEIGKARILHRMAQATLGNFGDCKPVGDSVSEMRIQYGPGYRVYFVRRGAVVYVLLCGGHKSTQKRDIAKSETVGKGVEGAWTMTAKQKSRTKVTYAQFEIADYLDSETVVAEYLSQAARDDNPGVLLKALSDVAKARGIAEVSKATGLGRESLYKTLAPGAKPRFETVAAIMKALGVSFAIEARKAKPARKLKAA